MLYPTKRLLEVASTITAHDPILEQLGPSLSALRDSTTETVILGKRQDDQIVYLDVVEGLNTIRYAAKPGKIVPLHSSAIGKAMLATLTPKELDLVIDSGRFERITGNTLTTSDALRADIAVGRERGYFITRGENVADVMGIARAVRGGSGWLGIAVAGPLPRMEANLEANIRQLNATCDTIERDDQT
jgi:DNA-binding IclR family transcriptional regulator